MNWAGAKNWLIVLFVTINIFLVITIVKSDMQSSVIEDKTIQSTVKILRQSDIFIDAKTIPTKMPKLGAIDVENSISDFDVFAEKILGESYIKESNTHYYLGTKSLVLSGDMISYTDSAPHDNIEQLKASTAQKYVSSWLSARGFETEVLGSYAYESDGGYLVRIEQKFDKYALLDSYFEVFVTSKGVTKLSGSWFVPSSGQNFFSNDAARVKSIISVLLDFARDNVRINRGSNNIVEIDLGYTTGDKNTYHKYATAVPVWRIRCSDKNEYFYEAR